MCEFKSGIILKNRCFIPDYDSHDAMLRELNIEDDYLNATHTFVRTEFVPCSGEWWTDPADPDLWKINIDQDEVPDWFDIDRDGYISKFRDAVREWWLSHVFVDKKIDELTTGYYRLKRCEVKKLCNDVKVMCDSSNVQEMCGSSSVQRMCGSSSVQRMYDSSNVQKMYGSSNVQEMHGSSSVQRMYDSSSVQRMYGSSNVQEMHGSSIARHYAAGKIFVSPDCGLTITVFENSKE